MPTTVVHCKRQPFDVLIDRTTKWGNPFKLQIDTEADRKKCLEFYRHWLMRQHHLLADLHELRGKVLGCWCAPKLCHGDVLAELADSEYLANKETPF
jgi:hypothetical protein